MAFSIAAVVMPAVLPVSMIPFAAPLGMFISTSRGATPRILGEIITATGIMHALAVPMPARATQSLRVLGQVLVVGEGIAYLWQPYSEYHAVAPESPSNCPHRCTQLQHLSLPATKVGGGGQRVGFESVILPCDCSAAGSRNVA
jgi:hypothetical protein